MATSFTIAAKNDTTIEAGGREVRVSSSDRVIFPATKQTGDITKLQIAEYYVAVGDGIMRALRERPTTLERWPKGVHEGMTISTARATRATPSTRSESPRERPTGSRRPASSSPPAATPTRSARPSLASSRGARRWGRSRSTPGR